MSPKNSSLLLVIVVAFFGNVAMGIEIRLKERVDLPSDRNVITLGDIADVRDADPKRVAQWKAVVLHPSPAAGNEVTLTHSLISSRLQASGLAMIDADFQGAGRVAVTMCDTRNLTPDGDSEASIRQQVLTLLEPHLKAYIVHRQPRIGSFHFQTLASAQGYQLLKTAVPSSVQLSMLPLDQTGRIYDAHINFQNSQGQPQQTSLRIQIEPYPYVLTTLTLMQRGQIIRQEDLAWLQLTEQQLQLSRNANYQTDPSQLIGTEVLKTLRPQEPITGDQVRKSPLVRSNEIVTVSVNVAAFSVSRQFKARHDAAMGESVTLTTLDGKETLTATVSGYRTAILSDTQTTANTQATSNSVQTANAQVVEILLSGNSPTGTSPLPFVDSSSAASTSMPNLTIKSANQAHVLPAIEKRFSRP